MKYQLIWTPLAEEDYSAILAFLELNYGLETALNFLDKTEATLERLQQFPFLFPISKKRPIVRKALISKYISLLYSVKGQEIWLLEFWDSRKNG